VYIHVDNTDLADVILNRELSKLQRGEINNVIYSDFDEQFQGIALIVILLLLLDSLILEGKK
jgi:batB protein